MGKGKFQPSWVNEFSWVALLEGGTSMVYCTICKKAFRIDVSGKWHRFSNHKSRSIKDGGQNTRKSQLLIAINEFSSHCYMERLAWTKRHHYLLSSVDWWVVVGGGGGGQSFLRDTYEVSTCALWSENTKKS